MLHLIEAVDIVDNPCGAAMAKNGWLTDAYSLAKTFAPVFRNKWMLFRGGGEEAAVNQRGELVVSILNILRSFSPVVMMG